MYISDAPYFSKSLSAIFFLYICGENGGSDKKIRPIHGVSKDSLLSGYNLDKDSSHIDSQPSKSWIKPRFITAEIDSLSYRERLDNVNCKSD